MPSQLQFGSLPDWLAAVGTVGAFLLTYLLLRSQLEDRAKGQAHSVAAWVSGRPDPDDEEGGGQWVAFVRNASNAPVYGCVVTVRDPMAPPGRQFTNDFGVVPPGETQEWPISRHDIDVDCNVMPGLDVEVSFTDARENHWRRDQAGALARLDRSPRFR